MSDDARATNATSDAAPDRPPGWEDAPERLIRLTSPDGTTVAWVCPELGANVVAYAVQTATGWGQVLHQDGTATLRERPSRFGLPILFPFPGHMLGGRYSWAGATYAMPLLDPNARSYTHGFAHQRPWRVTAQDGASLSAILDTRTDLEPSQRAGYPFDLTLSVQFTLEDDGLRLLLVAENVGAVAAPVGIGLHPYFDPAFFSVPDRTALSVSLPGHRARHLSAGPPVPTGGSEAATPGMSIQPVPLGSTILVSRTDFGEDRTASIAGGVDERSTLFVDLVMDEGWEDVLLFAPADGPSISLEPHTCAPGASSLPADSPDGLRGLDPSERLQVSASIRTPRLVV